MREGWLVDRVSSCVESSTTHLYSLGRVQEHSSGSSTDLRLAAQHLTPERLAVPQHDCQAAVA